MTNLDSILKSRDITLPTKVHLVKTMVFPVVMYGCESWTNPRDCSPPGSSVHGIFQARLLEWGAIAIIGNAKSFLELANKNDQSLSF